MTDDTIFTDEEWSLLVRLPQSVLSAASAVYRSGSLRARAEGTAGMNVIAGGRGSGDPLVEAIATEVIFRMAGDPAEGGRPPVAVVPADPATYVAETLSRSGQAGALLAAKVAGGSVAGSQAAAYRAWLISIAERVIEAAGAALPGVAAASRIEGGFVDRLRESLGG